MSKSDKVKQLHVAIYGMFGIGNTGNDATLEVTLAELRRRLPGARVTIITSNPKDVEAAFGLPAVAIQPKHAGAALPGPAGKLQREWARWRQAWALLRDVDCLLIPGTGILDDLGVGVMGHPHPLWRWCRAARQAGAQVKFVSIGAGPVEKAWSRRFFRWAAGSADHRSYRDANSRAFVRDELKLDVSNDVVTPDIVLALDVAPPPPQSPPRVIGVGVMDYHSWSGARGGADVYERYIAKMAAFTGGLLRQGCAIRILIGDTGDAPAVADFHARLVRDAPELAHAIETPAIATLRDLCAEVAKTDAVVATRYHTIIAALISGRPAVSIGYAVKNRAVMEDFGLGEFCQDIGDFDVETLRRHFETVTRDPSQPARLRGLTAQKRAQVSAHFAAVASEIAAAIS